MSQPILQVLVGFQTTANFGQPFQLDDSIFGRLNTGTLGGIQFADLTTMVQSVNINRGRSRQLQEFNAGTATVSFWNKSRALDPLNTASPYWNTSANMTGIVPRLPIRILADGIPIYTGVIQDWNVDYDTGNNDIVYATCADDFTVLANISLADHTVVTELTGARINTVLNYDEVLYQGARQIGAGSSTLGATTSNPDFSISQGTALLNYLQTITTSEQGYLYVSANGTLTFKGRTQVLNTPAGAIFSGDNSVGVPYQTLMNEFGDELLYNVIVTESPAGGPFTASDTTSIAQYQSQTYSETSLLNSSTVEVQALGQYLLGKFSQPQLRFTGLSTQLLALDTTKTNTCLNLELTDICTVVKHFAVGSPSSVSQTVIVTGISHNITPGSHIISYKFESTDGNQYFTLDNAIFGTLSTNNLLSF
jgi:hypothetical protein